MTLRGALIFGATFLALASACGEDEPLRSSPLAAAGSGAIDSGGGGASTGGSSGSAGSAVDAAADANDAGADSGIDATLDATPDALADADLDAPAGPVPDFSLVDENPTSASYQQTISPGLFKGQISAWYFGHST